MRPRITSGTAKNKKLAVPNIINYRGVQEKAKLAIFAILTPQKVENSVCLDLYAGSGNLGLESLSRGAKWCDFVDVSKKSQQTILKNLKACGFLGQANVFDERVIKHVGNTTNKYDIIFADPFYDDIHHKFLFENLEEILKKDGFIIFLHGSDTNVQDQLTNTDLKIITQRKFGKSLVSVIQH